MGLDHNMLAGSIDGSASSCGNFGTKTKRVCQGETATLSCVRGAIKVNSATYGRTDDSYCTAIPVDPETGVNASAQVRESCDGKGTCDVVADSSEFGDMGCATT